MRGDHLDRFGDVARRDRRDHQAVALAVFGPLPAEHDIEIRHTTTADLTTDAGETDIGNMVLATRVEAATGLDTQLANGRVELVFNDV